jgi:hypothetical protein
LQICRGYGFAIEQVLEMDLMAYLVANHSLAKIPLVDESVKAFFYGSTEKKKSSAAERRKQNLFRGKHR